MKKAIVTVLLGDYDTPKKAPQYKGWDCFMFTDGNVDKFLGWNVVNVETDNPKKDSRYYKWMTHETLPDYDLVCYMDASMTLRREPPSHDLWFTHSRRNSVKEEAEQLIKYKPELEDIITEQLDFYNSQRFNDDCGLYQNGYFVKEHNENNNMISLLTYSIIEKYSYRDQLALPYALYWADRKLKNVIKGSKTHLYATIHPHKWYTI